MVKDPPLMNCLHCKHYLINKHYCKKNWREDPIRTPLHPACALWELSKDAIFAWEKKEPSNPTEKWAKEKLQDMFRKAAYPRG